MLVKVYDPNCTLCPLHLTAKTVCVPGEGNPHARAVLIGEAPGRLEDANGRPFVGRAGTQLDRALALAFDSRAARQHVYITNVVKCRPPRNRDPNAIEIGYCHRYLEKELDLLDPEIVVTLGNVALETLTGRSGVMSHRGEWIYQRGVWVMPTIHPAATLYNPDLYKYLEEDLILVARKMGWNN